MDTFRGHDYILLYVVSDVSSYVLLMNTYNSVITFTKMFRVLLLFGVMAVCLESTS